MVVPESEIISIIQNICRVTLGLELAVCDEKANKIPLTPSLTACVQFAGGWRGAISIECSMGFANQAAAEMFGATISTIGLSEMTDSLGELTNIAAGNIKPLLPHSCELSMPSITEGSDYRMTVPGSCVISDLHFKWENDWIRVLMMQSDRIRD